MASPPASSHPPTGERATFPVNWRAGGRGSDWWALFHLPAAQVPIHQLVNRRAALSLVGALSALTPPSSHPPTGERAASAHFPSMLHTSALHTCQLDSPRCSQTQESAFPYIWRDGSLAKSRWPTGERTAHADSDPEARHPAPPSKRPALPDQVMGGVKPTNLAKVGLTLSDS